MKPNATITATLRKAIRDKIAGGATFKGLQRETGIIRQNLMRFVSGERHLRGDILDKLAEYFELELVPTKRGKRKAK